MYRMLRLPARSVSTMQADKEFLMESVAMFRQRNRANCFKTKREWKAYTQLIKNESDSRNESDVFSYNRQMRARTILDAYEQLTPNEMAYFSAIIPEVARKKREGIVQKDEEMIDAIEGLLRRKLREQGC